MGDRLGRLRTGGAVALASLAGRRRPLFVGWSLTDACDGACSYCGRPDRGLDGFSGERAVSLADEIAAAGVLRVSLTGGEPLLHPAALAVAERLHRSGVTVALNSNGGELARHADRLAHVISSVTVSIDGDREAHDAQRGEGSWQRAVTGARAAREAGLPVNLHTVITAKNTHAVDEALDLAIALDGRVGFSVLEHGPAMDRKDLDDLLPTPEQWRAVVDDLLARKRLGEPRIQNSTAGLRHLRHWPDHHPIRCSAGLVYARIEPDGRLYGCGNLVDAGDGPDLHEMTFRDAFAALPRRDCEACWCDTRVEMNLVLAGRPTALRAAWVR